MGKYSEMYVTTCNITYTNYEFMRVIVMYLSQCVMRLIDDAHMFYV